MAVPGHDFQTMIPKRSQIFRSGVLWGVLYKDLCHFFLWFLMYGFLLSLQWRRWVLSKSLVKQIHINNRSSLDDIQHHVSMPQIFNAVICVLYGKAFWHYCITVSFNSGWAVSKLLNCLALKVALWYPYDVSPHLICRYQLIKRLLRSLFVIRYYCTRGSHTHSHTHTHASGEQASSRKSVLSYL